MGGFLAGSLLILAPRRIRWGLYAAVGGGVLVAALVWHGPAATTLWLVESTLVTGLVVYSVSSLSTMVVEAHAAREGLARMVVAQEQFRVHGELHRVLGRNLTGIADRLELVTSMLASVPGRAKAELAEILQIARQALVDVRTVARDYRRVSLGVEADTAVAALSSAGVDATAVISGSALPPDVDGFLANVLRELVASHLLLARGRRCLIEAGAVDGAARLRVAIDETGTDLDLDLDLDYLRARIEAAGGSLSVRVDEHDRFELIAAVPISDAPRSPSEPQRSQRKRSLAIASDVSLRGRPVARRTAFTMTLLVLSAYAMVTAVFVIAEGLTGAGLAGFAVCLGMVFSLQVAHSSGATVNRPAVVRALLLFVQAIATYLPLLWLGQRWGAMAGFLAGAVLLTVVEPWCWVLYGTVAGGIAFTLWLEGLPPISIVYGAVFTLQTGLIVYGISSLQALVTEVHKARGPLVRMAVVQERLRIARDLHDLLSYSLSAISLKTELAYQLLPRAVDRARQELAELLVITRRALTDVDRAASGHPHVSLRMDGESARSTLAASGIEGTVQISCGPLPHETETVLAIVLREAATNILRHSKARKYRIEVKREGSVLTLHVANDGAMVNERLDSDLSGAGLPNLETRLRAVGGSLTAGLDGEGWFHLRAVVPVSTPDGKRPFTDG